MPISDWLTDRAETARKQRTENTGRQGLWSTVRKIGQGSGKTIRLSKSGRHRVDQEAIFYGTGLLKR
jgi:hypothetical protein